MVPVPGPSAAVLLHQVRHLLKLLRVNISVSVQIKHLEGNLEMTEWRRLKIFLSVRLVEFSPPGGGENSQEKDVVREADEAARPELVEDGLGVEVEAGGDSGDLRQGDLLELVQAEVLGLLLPRRYGPRPQFTNSKFVEFVPCQPYSLVVIDYSKVGLRQNVLITGGNPVESSRLQSCPSHQPACRLRSIGKPDQWGY